MTRWRWILTQLNRRLWVRASIIGLMGIAAAVLAAVIERFIPWPLPTTIGADAVDSILNIIASSMLAVTTFSLSVMTAAYGSATSNVTPRATKLLIEDQLTQTVLSTFIGSFLFSIVGIVVLKTGAYGDRGRFVLFIVTIAVIALVVISLLRWINHLTRLGRVGETTERVELAARQAIKDRLSKPYLGGNPLSNTEAPIPQEAIAIQGQHIGYVLHIDMSELQRFANTLEINVYVTAIPGTLVYPDTVIAWFTPPTDSTTDEAATQIFKAFTLRNERHFDQDPRFGLAVMSEIGLRAISPAVNDPGTAIDVINRITRLMYIWSDAQPIASEKVDYPRVFVTPLCTDDLFEDAYMLLARDGAGLIEIQLRLQKSLLALARCGNQAYRRAALNQAQRAQERAEAALVFPADLERLHATISHHQPPAKSTTNSCPT